MTVFSALRRAGRTLRRKPGSTTAAALTLALGIAVSTAVFTLANTVLFRELPYPESARIISLQSRMQGKPASGLSWQDIRDLDAGARTISHSAVFRKRSFGLSDNTGRPLEIVLSGMVTHKFFPALGVTPALGQPFAASQEEPGGNRVVWLSHNLWQRRYSASPQAIGGVLSLNGAEYRIAGVLPAWFRFLIDGENPDLYFPLDQKDYCCARDARSLGAVARLAPGVSPESARAELAVVSERLRLAHSGTNSRVQFEAQDLKSALTGSRRKPLLLLLAAAGFLMLVASINAGGLLLARAAREVRETAIRLSLGANWRTLIAERFAESVWLTAAAGILGFAAGCALLRGAAMLPPLETTLADYARYGALWPDATVLAVALALAFAGALLASLIPLLALRRAGIEQLLRAGSGASASRGAVWGRNSLAAAQIALSATLLISGALVLRSLYHTLGSERGYRTDQIVIAGIGIPEARYDTDPKMTSFHTQAIERLRAIPGVSAAAGGAGVPVGTWRTRFLREGEELPKPERPSAAIAIASPGLFRLLEIPVVSGRDFSSGDRLGQPYVALVNQTFVTRYLAGRRTLGQRIRVGFWNGQMKPWSDFQVIGVVADTRNRSLDAPPEPAIFLSSTQIALEGFSYMARTSRPAAGLVRDFREAIWRIDRNIEAVTPQPLSRHVEGGLSERRFVVWLLGGFAVLSLLIAVAGLAAGLANSVAQARREFGIRIALGELPRQIVARVLRGAAWIAAFGLLGGIAGAAAVKRLIASQIVGISAMDPTAILGVVAILVCATLASAAVPAWRAARIDPLKSLREN